MYGPVEPDYSTVTGIVHHLNTEELKKLLNDDAGMEGMLKDAPQIRNIETEKEVILTSNKSIAEFNLSKEPQLREARQRLVETYEKALDVCREAEEKKQQIEELSKQNSLDATLAVLQAAAAQSEEDSEGIAAKFLDGGVDVETFLEDFQNKRKLAHLRRIKADKLNELLNVSNQVAPPAPYGNAGPWNLARSAYNNRLPVQGY